MVQKQSFVPQLVIRVPPPPCNTCRHQGVCCDSRWEDCNGKIGSSDCLWSRHYFDPGNFDEALKAVRDIAETEAVALVNSVNPLSFRGSKTAAFEICEQLEKAPDVLAIPVGNAGNISAY